MTILYNGCFFCDFVKKQIIPHAFVGIHLTLFLNICSIQFIFYLNLPIGSVLLLLIRATLLWLVSQCLKSLQITKLNAPKYDTAIFDIIFGENHSSFRLELSYKRMVVKICKILSFVRVPCFLHKYRLFKSQF